MANVTFFVMIPFKRMKGGIVAQAGVQCSSERSALSQEAKWFRATDIRVVPFPVFGSLATVLRLRRPVLLSKLESVPKPWAAQNDEKSKRETNADHFPDFSFRSSRGVVWMRQPHANN